MSDRENEDVPKKSDVQDRLQDAIEKLSKLLPEERMDVYEELFGPSGRMPDNPRRLIACNRMVLPINTYVFPVFRREDAEISKDGFVVARKPRVFLSHSHRDKRLARTIYARLKCEGIRVWFDEAELRFGDSLIQKLRSAIDSVDILLALISRHSVESEWVTKEVEIAMNQEIERRRVKVIALLCDEIELPGFLVGKLYADLRSQKSRAQNLTKLAADIKAHLEEAG